MREDKWVYSYIHHRDKVSVFNCFYVWYYCERQVSSCPLPQILHVFAYAPSITT